MLAKKHELAKTSPVKLVVTCATANYTEEWICTDDKYWNEMGEISHDSSCRHVNIYHLEIEINVSKKELIYSKLYNDKETTDFHLCTEEGSVPVHKACLAAHSDVFSTMFNGAWKETANNRIEVAGVTLETLQQLKDYLYLGVLPEGTLLPLLLLANYYFIENLEAECITKLVQTVTPENFYSLLDFAFENRISELTFGILRKTPKLNDVVQGAHQLMKKTRVSKLEVSHS